ncbi:MAG: RadC family protein [Bacteroidia bacterium]
MRKSTEKGVDLRILQNKFLTDGKTAMNNSELLVLVLGNGRRTMKSQHLGERLWSYCNGDLRNLGQMSMEELLQVEGLGSAGVVTLAAAFELGRRRVVEEPKCRQIRNPSDSVALFRPLFLDAVVESFYVVYLNRANRVLRLECISIGGMAGTVVDVRLVFKRALELRATGIIMCHNHPSGNDSPSESDRKLTKQFVHAGKLLDILVIDHVIIAGSRYFSFAEEGTLNQL